MKTNYIKADLAERDFFRVPRHFASIVNATVFDGRQVLSCQNIQELDSSESMIVGNRGEESFRDLIKRVVIDGKVILIGIECQNVSQRNMVFRSCHYDSLRYLKALKTSQKADAILTIILYFHEYRWNNSRSIYASVGEFPEELKKYINNWNLNIFDIKEIDVEKIEDEETKVFIKAIQTIYRIKKNPSKLPEDLEMSQDIAIRVAAITKFPELIKRVKQAKEGEKICMCDALKMMKECSRNEGRKQGFNIGKKQGFNDGKKQGFNNGRKKERAYLQKKNVITMLSKGFDISTIAECLSISENQVKTYAKTMPVH